MLSWRRTAALRMFKTLVRVHVLKICCLLSGRWSMISDTWYLIRGRRIMGDKITDITDLGSGIMDQRSGNILNTLTKVVNIHYAPVLRHANMSYVCNICGKNFTIRSNLKRHKKNMHGTNRLTQSTLLDNGLTVLQHPFTCIVAGCTQSGKTVWVKTLLENAQTSNSPPRDRCTWKWLQVGPYQALNSTKVYLSHWLWWFYRRLGAKPYSLNVYTQWQNLSKYIFTVHFMYIMFIHRPALQQDIWVSTCALCIRQRFFPSLQCYRPRQSYGSIRGR